MPLNLKKNILYPITIDGEVVRTYIKRMTVAEFAAFEAEFWARVKGRRSQIVTEAVAGESPEDAFDRQLQEKTKASVEYTDWLCSVFDRFLTIEPGDLAFEGEPVTSGRRFVQVLAFYGAVVQDALQQIYLRNRVSDEQKKTSALLLASRIGSPSARPLAAPGAAPETTATSAEPLISADPAAVTDPSASASSGTTDPSSSAPAPSAS